MADSPYVIAVTVKSFQHVVVEGSYERLVLVDFWAPWCGPCRMMAPAFKAAVRVLELQARLVKVNTEEAQVTVSRFGIRSIPTLVLFEDGQEVTRTTGAMDTDHLVAWVRQWL